LEKGETNMIVKNVEKKEKSTVSFDVLCDAAEFEKALNAAYLKNKSKIFVQGFRKGKAPRMIIEGMYGKDVFYEEATDELAPTAFTFASEQEKLRTVGTPSVTNVDVSEGKELTISFVTAVWPEVTLGEYKGIEAPRAKVEITEEQVDAEMAKIQKRNARIVAVERPAQNGDTATIDFEGSVDGVPFDGGKGEGYGLVLGSNSFIPGFEDQVVGMTAGEEKDIDVTFPEDYHEASLAGKPAVFHVKVSEVKEEQLPELDDEFAKDVSDFDTLADYRNAVKNRIDVSEKDAAEADFQNALIEKAGDSITAEIPEAMVEEQIDSMIREYDQNLQMNGLNLQMYMQYIGQDINTFRNQCRPTAERRVKTELLLDKIAEVEGIEVTAEEIAEEYQKVADQYDTELATVKSAVPESAIVGDMKARRAAEIIFNTGVPTEPVAEEAPAAEEAAEEKKPAKKTTKKATTKKAAAEEAPAAEEAAEEAKPAKKTTKKTATKKAAAEEDTQSEE
jgi:trigger factor